MMTLAQQNLIAYNYVMTRHQLVGMSKMPGGLTLHTGTVSERARLYCGR